MASRIEQVTAPTAAITTAFLDASGLSWITLVLGAVLGAFGGAASSLRGYDIAPEQMNIGRVARSALVGGFAGLLATLLASTFNWEINQTMFYAGIFGFGGQLLLDPLVDAISRGLGAFFGGNPPPPPPQHRSEIWPDWDHSDEGPVRRADHAEKRDGPSE